MATKTMRYGSDAVKPESSTSDESARAFAERHVIEMNGETIRQNKNFDALVKDAQEQIEANRKNTEGM